MEKEENVYGGFPGAEQVAGATEEKSERENDVWKGSAALGKFKDVDALAKAYTALQAEFTRRSQRLKELERKAENFAQKDEKEEKDAASSVGSGAEKLRKNLREKKAAEAQFDRFVSEIESGLNAKPAKQSPDEGETVAAGEHTDGNTEKIVAGEAEKSFSDAGSYGAAEPSERESETFVANDRETAGRAGEDLYLRASRDEGVRLRIIGEYLDSLGRSGAPLMRGGTGAFVAPTLKARTIDDAGNMALRLFKEKKANE